MILLVLAGGCASLSHVQTADTLGKKNFQIAVEAGLQRSPSPYLPYYPHFDATARLGLTDTIDVGVRVGYSGLEFQGKFLLTEPGHPRLAISLAPTVSGGLIPGAASTLVMFNAAAPLLIGLKQDNGNEFVFGPRLQTRFMLAPSQAAALELGLSVGYSIRIGQKFAILPEFAAALPLVQSTGAQALLGTPSPFAPDAMSFGNHFMFQFKVGFAFGRQRQRSNPNP